MDNDNTEEKKELEITETPAPSTDVAPMPNAKDFFYQMNIRGLIEMVDAVTGNVIAVQRDYNTDLLSGKKHDFIKYQLEDGSIVLGQKGLDLSKYVATSYVYNKAQADIVCHKIVNGELLTDICKQPGMPNYATLTRWRMEHPDFSHLLEVARRARAEVFQDKAVQAVDEDKLAVMTKDDIMATKLRVDTLKWAAEKNDPSRFGNKDSRGAQAGGALQIVVNTGINRDDSHESEADIDKIVEISDYVRKDSLL